MSVNGEGVNHQVETKVMIETREECRAEGLFKYNSTNIFEHQIYARHDSRNLSHISHCPCGIYGSYFQDLKDKYYGDVFKREWKMGDQIG